MQADLTTQVAPLADTVIEGLDGYLFHRDHEAVEQISGSMKLNAAEVDIWRRLIEERSAWCRDHGIVFRFLIVPEKHVVYADMLPNVAISDIRPATQIIASLSETVRAELLYPVDVLRDLRSRFESYFVTDSHWTERGAFAVYEALLRSLPHGFIESAVTICDLGYKTRSLVGDLGRRLETERGETSVSLFHQPPRPFALLYHNRLNTRGSTIVYEGDPGGKRMVAFRDSFFSYIVPHLIPVMSRTVLVSSIDIFRDLIVSECPDLIVCEIAERFLGNLDGLGQRILPGDDPGATFASFSGIRPADLREATGLPFL